MTLADMVDHYLLRAEPVPVRSSAGEFVDIDQVVEFVNAVVMETLVQVTSHINRDCPQVGFEVDLGSLYDFDSDMVSTDVELKALGAAPPEVMLYLVSCGFDYIVETKSFSVNLIHPLQRLRECL